MLRLSFAVLIATAVCGLPSISLADEAPAAKSAPTDTQSSGPTEHECEHRKKEQATS